MTAPRILMKWQGNALFHLAKVLTAQNHHRLQQPYVPIVLKVIYLASRQSNHHLILLHAVYPSIDHRFNHKDHALFKTYMPCPFLDHNAEYSAVHDKYAQCHDRNILEQYYSLLRCATD